MRRRRNALVKDLVSWLDANSRAMSIDMALSTCCDDRRNAY